MAGRFRQTLLQFDCAEKPVVPALLSPDDLYDRLPALIPTLGEDRRVERKPPGFHAKNLGEYLSCWANTSPDGGIIAIGVEDKTGRLLGCSSIDQKRLNALESAGHIHCPEAQYSTKRVPVTNCDGKPDFLLLFRVKYHQTRVVETSDRKIYVRRGDSCCELKTDDERQQLRIDKGEIQFEQQESGLTFPDDFNVQEIRHWAGKVRE